VNTEIAPTPPKPTPINYTFDKIPLYFRARTQWVCWRYELKQNGKGEQKWTKVPKQTRALGVSASTTSPATWATFDEAVAAYQNPEAQYDGIGYAIDAETEQIVGVDIDHCLGDDAAPGMAERAKDILITLNSYAEKSVSGTGLHIYAFGPLPAGARKKGGIEMYAWGRYLTFTGCRFKGYETVESRPAAIAAIHAKHLGVEPTKVQPPVPAGPAAAEEAHTDDEVLAKAREPWKNHDRFLALYDRGDHRGYASQSEADLALCGMLAFWAGPHPEQIDRLFRASMLMREKWTTKRGPSTYGLDTIATALAGRTEFYSWPCAGPTVCGDEGARDAGGERFTDREHARLFEVFSAGEVRHADEMGEKWYQITPLRWSLDFKTAIVPYVQRIVNHFFACSDQERDVADERREQLPTNKSKKGAAA